MNKTKIVCTIGPSSSSKNDIKKLIMSGMNIVRLNSAHNTLQWHTHIIKLIRALDKNIPIIFDLPGRKIRIKDLSNPYTVAEGKELIFTCDQNYAGSDKISLDYNNLHRDLKTGDVILADDGSLKFKVKKIIDSDIYCQIFTNGELKNRKGLNVPYIKINTPVVNKRDRNLIRFAIDNKVDWIGFSFAECAEHVKEIRNLLKNSNIGIISKIENKFGVEKIEEIIKESEGLLIDRGDLGAETSIEKIGILQKEIIKKASEHGKPVIIATEMLHSMIEKFYPTKAEVIDISNAILDGASAIMLSGETAVGKYPVEAVRVMRSIANEVEKSYLNYNNNLNFSITHKTIPNAIAKSIFEVCKEMPITKVVCVTLSGYAARMISRYRIPQPILAVTDSPEKARKFNLLWGVQGIYLKISFHRKKIQHIIKSCELLWQTGKLSKEDLVILTGVMMPLGQNKNNYMQIHRVGHIVELFGWRKKIIT